MQWWTISQPDCDMQPKVDFIQQLVMTSSVAGPRRSCKALSKARLAHGHCLVVCCWSDPLQLSESWRNHYIWEVCSANWWDAPKTAMPAAVIGQQKGPNSSPQQCLTIHCSTNASEVEWIGLRSFASFAIFTWPLANWLPLLQQGKCFHNQQEAENAFQEFVESQRMDFYTTGINPLISCWQKCVDCNDSYFD